LVAKSSIIVTGEVNPSQEVAGVTVLTSEKCDSELILMHFTFMDTTYNQKNPEACTMFNVFVWYFCIDGIYCN
jgi:hypothetical protein